MNNKYSNITFSEIIDYLKASSRNISESTVEFSKLDPNKLLSRLCSVCESFGLVKAAKICSPPPEYKQYWNEFLSGRRDDLDRRTLRFLCWEPDIAITTHFIEYIYEKKIENSHRAIQGLVRACHRRWSVMTNDSPLFRLKGFDKIRNIVEKYKGSSKIVQLWQSEIDTILGINGPKLYASKMVATQKAIDEFVELWGLDHDSEYIGHAVKEAGRECEQDLYSDRKLSYLFQVILPWKRWDITGFKEEICKLIINKQIQGNEIIKESLKKFILSDERLGDPRLPRNHKNWIDMGHEAHERFIQWLSQADITFFFEHVLPKGRDPHGRKEFWLQYINKLIASRPMLCPLDEARLKSVLIKERDSIGHFGHIYTGSSVFLLDFGHILAVEFSKLGACYIYNANTFKQVFPDFWSTRYFADSKFKDMGKKDKRVVHRKFWQGELRNILSMYGIRPH